MSTATFTLPIAAAPAASASSRPGVGRLTRVELRKMLDTRAGFWLQVATVGLTVVAVVIRLAVGNPQDHTFRSVLEVGLAPASVLLAGRGRLLVPRAWSHA